MILNPMSDMDWDIYLDYLSDQGFDELRNVDVHNLGEFCFKGYDFCISGFNDGYQGNPETIFVFDDSGVEKMTTATGRTNSGFKEGHGTPWDTIEYGDGNEI